jgi:oxalate decarboxylase/phosphoglucose isomerase-like protein (cupin superfamily)
MLENKWKIFGEDKDQMLSVRTVMMAGLVAGAFGAGWLAQSSAQQTAPAPLITYFSHENVDKSFEQALATTGSVDLFTRKDRQGRTWTIHSNSRGKSDEGKLHSHENWTGVVVIMSGAATFITPGTASRGKVTGATQEGAQLIGRGETHRVSKGDVVIIPPDAPHMYKNIEGPFRYLVIQTP